MSSSSMLLCEPIESGIQLNEVPAADEHTVLGLAEWLLKDAAHVDRLCATTVAIRNWCHASWRSH